MPRRVSPESKHDFFGGLPSLGEFGLHSLPPDVEGAMRLGAGDPNWKLFYRLYKRDAYKGVERYACAIWLVDMKLSEIPLPSLFIAKYAVPFGWLPLNRYRVMRSIGSRLYKRTGLLAFRAPDSFQPESIEAV